MIVEEKDRGPSCPRCKRIPDEKVAPKKITKGGSNMKKLFVVLAMVILLMTVSCSHTKVYILGVEVAEVTKEKDAAMMLLGAAVSWLTHLAGHYIAGELVEADIEQQGNHEILLNYWELNDSDRRWFYRGGFVAQTLVNTGLTSFKSTRKSKFTKGFTLSTMLHIGTYPIRYNGDDEGDLIGLDNNNGEGTSEWTLYMGIAAYNLYRTSREE